MREVKLPSGNILKVNAAPFEDARALWKAFLKIAKGVDSKDASGVIRDVFCAGFSSDELESCLWTCFGRCLYGERKIDKDTFEPVENREDYLKVSIEVAKENILPFTKSLYADFQDALSMVANIQV